MGKVKPCVVCKRNKENVNDYQDQNLSTFQFPSSPTRRSRWIENLCLKPGEIKKYSRVCQRHFSTSQFIRDRLKPRAVPIHALELDTSSSSNQLDAKRDNARRVLGMEFQIQRVKKPTPFVTSVQLSPCTNSNTLANQVDSPTRINFSNTRTIGTQCNLNYKRNDIRQLKRLQSKINGLQHTLKERVDLSTILSKNKILHNLITSQVERFKHTGKPYSDFEKTTALSLYYACGPNGYTTMKKLGLSLPTRSTLQRWTSEFKMFTGVNQRLLECIKELATKFEAREMDCVITWDEVSIKEFVEYNKFYDKFEGLVDFGVHLRTLEIANEALVFMIRGINCKWRFPISYYFSKQSTSSEMLDALVSENITAVQNIGFNVRIGICDMSFTNQGLYRTWGITKSSPFKFINNSKIYFVHDSPHLIKLIRNNLLKHNFNITVPRNDRKVSGLVKWQHIKSFYEKDRRVLSRMAPKLTAAHIFLKDYGKMRVKFATQVFSHSVYAGIMAMCRLKILKDDAIITALFVKKVDEMFDFFNMSRYSDDKWGRCAEHFYSNINKFDEYLDLLESLSIPGLSREPDFLKGWKITVSGIKMLALDLKAVGYTHLYTRNLQQDCLENFFSLVRSKGGYCRNPTARCFRTNFRFLFFATLVHAPQTGNTEAGQDICSFFKYTENMKNVLKVNPNELDQTNCNTGMLENIDSHKAALFYSVTLGKRLKYGAIQEATVSSYIGAACIHALCKLTDCANCKEMLVPKSLTNQLNPCNFVLIDFKQYDVRSNHLSYMRNEECVMFEFLNNYFLKCACKSLQSSGENILVNIFQAFIQEKKVQAWLSCPCRSHRENILKYFIRAKLYRLVKDKNEKIKQIRAWNQTRRDLRNQ